MYQQVTTDRTESKMGHPQGGVALITGANANIGKECARQLGLLSPI